MVTDRPTKAHGLTLKMRTPTARVIENYLVDYAYGIGAARTPGVGPASPLERDLAKVIDLGMKIGKTRTLLLLPDQKDLLEAFKQQLGIVCQGLHPWQGGPLPRNYAKSIWRVVADVEKFQARSVVDKMVDALGE